MHNCCNFKTCWIHTFWQHFDLPTLFGERSAIFRDSGWGGFHSSELIYIRQRSSGCMWIHLHSSQPFFFVIQLDYSASPYMQSSSYFRMQLHSFALIGIYLHWYSLICPEYILIFFFCIQMNFSTIICICVHLYLFIFIHLHSSAFTCIPVHKFTFIWLYPPSFTFICIHAKLSFI